MINAPLPNTADPAFVPQQDQLSAHRLRDYFRTQIQEGMGRRRKHAITWSKIHAIMSGIHYFVVSQGEIVPLDKDPKEIRAYTPVMVPKYRIELGRILSNDIGAQVIARTGYSGAFAHAARGQAIIDDWAQEVDLEDIFDETIQHLLFYGTVGLYRYIDAFRQQVMVEPIPGCELFPIPYDARNWRSADGVARCTLVTKQWLEQQDMLVEKATGRPPEVLYSTLAKSLSTSMGGSHMGFNVLNSMGGRVDGAIATWIWMKPSLQFPNGFRGFMIDDRVFVWQVAPDANGQMPLRNGRLPITPITYTKMAHDWWADGFLSQLVAPQMERNRQWTDVLEASRRNRGYLGVNADMVDVNTVGTTPDGIVPFDMHGYEMSKIPPLMPIPPSAMNQHVAAAMQISGQIAEEAANHESGIITGRAEGRTDSASANALLNENAQAPLIPVFKRIRRAFKITLTDVLDMIPSVWPAQKTLSVVGEDGIGQELVIQREQIPSSRMVLVLPNPMIPNGTSAQVNMLLRLRSIPADDGNGFEIKSREFRRSLSLMGMSPRGLELADKRELRIKKRIRLLIGDGQTPQIPPASTGEAPFQRFEDHRIAAELLRDAILDDSFRMYGPDVQQALIGEFQFHSELLSGIQPPNNIDDAVEAEDARAAEEALYGSELSEDLIGQM